MKKEISILEQMILLEDMCATCSNLDIVYDIPEYNKLMGNGTELIPFLLERIDYSNIWFNALRDITKLPVDKDVRGNITKTVEVWKKWGKENGY